MPWLRKLSTCCSLLLLVSCPLWATALEQSPADSRQYQLLTLNNGLEVLLVSDPKAERAAASLDVKIGSAADPKNFEGLAHFLEHMLFLGTDRYPDPGEYDAFMRQNGGEHNAFTSSEHTNYFFSLAPDALPGALDRFARFFIAPRFDAKLVERERNAVDSEYRLKLKEDSRRLDQLLKTIGNPAHPYNRFAVGSLTTLTDQPGQKLMPRLKAFYQQYYQASNMKLVVVGREPLEQLKRWVEPRFNAISNAPVVREPVRALLTRPEQQGVLLEAKAVGEARKLELNFSLPALKPWQADRPDLYLAQVLGHEGAGSLSAYLKQRGWATALNAGLSLDLDDSARFSLDIDLTPEGVNAYREVAQASFAYLNLLRAQQPEHFFNELQRILALEFRYQEQSQPVELVLQLAQNLHQYDDAEVLSGPYKLRRFRPDVVKRLLDYLTPERVQLVLLHPNLSSTQRERWYQTPYRLSSLPQELLNQWQHSQLDALALPVANPYLPERLERQTPESAESRPVLLQQTDRLRLWHQQTTPFRLPKSEVRILLNSAQTNADPVQGALANLWVDYLRYRLNETGYLATMAGLSFEIRKTTNGLELSLSGFSDRQPQLLAQIVHELAQPVRSPELVRLLANTLSRRWQNLLLSAPYKLAGLELQSLLQGPSWPLREYLQVIGAQDLTALEQFRQRLLAQGQIQMLVLGDLSAQQSQQMAQTLLEPLKITPAPFAATTNSRLPAGRHYRDLSAQHQDNALLWYLQTRDASLHAQAVSALLGQLLQPAYYQELRTQQQLGYVVNASSFNLNELGGLAFIVQSPIQNTDELLKRTQTFIQAFQQRLQQLPAAELDRFKQGLVAELRQKPLNATELADEIWDSLNTGLELERKERLAEQINGLSLADLQQGLAELLDLKSGQLVIRVTGQNSKLAAPVTRPAAESLTDPIKFKASLPVLSYPKAPASP